MQNKNHKRKDLMMTETTMIDMNQPIEYYPPIPMREDMGGAGGVAHRLVQSDGRIVGRMRAGTGFTRRVDG